jgi:pyruvate/2-oxoglutarate dehydrogenase complex dihydrolipoamide dehydrogenase (E3) component
LWDVLEQSAALPRRIAIVGGGPVGCELAQAFARLGAQVSLVEAAPALLSKEDADVSALVQAALSADGVRVFPGHQVLRCETLPAHAGADKLMVLRQNTMRQSGSSRGLATSAAQDVEFALPYDLLLCATGRQARLRGFGLEALGIASDTLLHTDAYLQTLIPSIYAAGDVVGPYQFTHAAAHQAWYAAVNALLDGWGALRPDYSVLPTAVYVAPEVARVGLNEQQAQTRGLAYEVTRFELAGLDRAICDAPNGAAPAGFVKVLTVPGRDTLLGVSIVGEHAAELLAPYALAMRQGLGLKAILATIHSYPTLSESARHVAGQWQRAHLPAAVMPWLARWHRWRRG